MLIQPSMVTHWERIIKTLDSTDSLLDGIIATFCEECTWKTVSMAKPMLSKEVIPSLGPSHFSRQMDTVRSQV